MELESLNEGEEPSAHSINREAKAAKAITSDLARSFLEFIEHHANDEIGLVGCYDLSEGVEGVQIEFPTGTHQEPAYDVRPVESLLVMFLKGSAPAVASLRPSFPMTKHTFGLEIDAPTDAQVALCIDDRAWEDASSDYNGAEIVRRIASWFRRAITGNMDDELQFQDPVFLPSPASIVVGTTIEKQILEQESHPLFLAIVQGDEGSNTYFGHAYDDAPPPDEGKIWTPFLVISLARVANNTGAMWRPPSNLGQLSQSVSSTDNELLTQLRDTLSSFWASLEGAEHDKLKTANLLIHIAIRNADLDRYESYWLMARESVADIAVGLGILLPPDPDVGSDYVLRLTRGELDADALAKVGFMSANSFGSFENHLARAMSGLELIAEHATILGVGSIGSQITINLVREGAFERITLIDNDRLLPHNLARHTLTSSSISHLKSSEIAKHIKDISADFVVKALGSKLDSSESDKEVQQALSSSSIVFDFTASVGASRDLSDCLSRGRAVSAFFNPLGNAYVVLAEDEAGHCDLACLEAEYYAQVAQIDDLADHLSDPNRVVVSSGQCRSVSNRLCASDAALLSAAATKSIRKVVSEPSASITVGTIGYDGSLQNRHIKVSAGSIMVEIDGWTIRMSAAVEARLRSARDQGLPCETGGVLLGIVDHRRKRVEIAHMLPPPADSSFAATEFVRGVSGLRDAIDQVSARVMHQLTYVGEWHSHPKGASATPSLVDHVQINELALDLASESRPAVMVIVGEKETCIAAME